MNATRDKVNIRIMVQIIQKQDQRTGKLTEGIVKRILTSSNFHPHGIKVELENGKIGRIQNNSRIVFVNLTFGICNSRFE